MTARFPSSGAETEPEPDRKAMLLCWLCDMLTPRQASRRLCGCCRPLPGTGSPQGRPDEKGQQFRMRGGRKTSFLQTCRGAGEGTVTGSRAALSSRLPARFFDSCKRLLQCARARGFHSSLSLYLRDGLKFTPLPRWCVGIIPGRRGRPWSL